LQAWDGLALLSQKSLHSLEPHVSARHVHEITGAASSMLEGGPLLAQMVFDGAPL
jgi:hypothetical protein